VPAGNQGSWAALLGPGGETTRPAFTWWSFNTLSTKVWYTLLGKSSGSFEASLRLTGGESPLKTRYSSMIDFTLLAPWRATGIDLAFSAYHENVFPAEKDERDSTTRDLAKL
jgi:hypothetical protein